MKTIELNKKLGLGLAIFAIVFLTWTSAAQAATLTVTKTADTNDGVCDADCSLREAMAAAMAGDTINFASPLFDTAQIITTTSELVFTKSLNINGRGARLLTVQGQQTGGNFRIFTAEGVFTINISGLTMTGGLTSNGGGGIFINNATVTLDGVVVNANESDGCGGGIRHQNGTTTILNSTVSNNINNGGPGSQAGGVCIIGGTVTITNSTISGNTVDSGTATGHGGAIVITGQIPGAVLNLYSDTITNNSDTSDPANTLDKTGGVYQPGGANSTVNVRNTIIAGNIAIGNNNQDVRGIFTSQGYNLIGITGSAVGINQTGDQSGTNAAPLDPLIFALANNGGQTDTHALRSNSPALDQGSSFGLTTDQRGATRPVDLATIANAADGSDIGAYEVQLSPTAAAVTLAGRVFTPAGKGLRNVRVNLTDHTGNTRTVLTSAFGYYRFPDVAAGETYIIAVTSKSYSFAPQVVSVTEDVGELNFTGQ